MTHHTVMRTSALALLAGATLLAQSKPATKIPRTPDGHPDLQGIWSNATRTPLERSAEFANKPTLTEAEAKAWDKKEHQAWQDLDGTSEGPLHKGKGSEGTGAYNVLFYDMGNGLARVDGVARTSMVIDPPDGHIPPVTAAAKERRAAGVRAANMDDVKNRPATERCLVGDGAFAPMLPVLYNDNYQIVQTPDAVMIMTEMIHDVRIIRINGTHAAPDVRQWFGDSIGHWDGDTLVVETTNFSDKNHFRGATSDMKLIERFKRVDANNLLYRATIDDPATWTKPWTLEYPFVAAPGPIYEYACHEGNYALEDVLGGARRLESK